MIYLKLFINFFKIGLFTFGGGYAMIPMIQELVLSNKWMDTKQMVDFIAISETTPGPLAINMSTYVGYEVAGIPGAFCSTFAVALPSFIVIILVARAYKKFKDNKVVVAVMNGKTGSRRTCRSSGFICCRKCIYRWKLSFKNINIG